MHGDRSVRLSSRMGLAAGACGLRCLGFKVRFDILNNLIIHRANTYSNYRILTWEIYYSLLTEMKLDEQKDNGFLLS